MDSMILFVADRLTPFSPGAASAIMERASALNAMNSELVSEKSPLKYGTPSSPSPSMMRSARGAALANEKCRSPSLALRKLCDFGNDNSRFALLRGADEDGQSGRAADGASPHVGANRSTELSDDRSFGKPMVMLEFEYGPWRAGLHHISGHDTGSRIGPTDEA